MTADIDSVVLELARANREHREAEASLAAASSRLERAREQLRAAEPILATSTSTSTSIDLDDDPRDPDTQAAEFFTRAGDFHQVDIAIPLDDDPLGLKLGAQFVIKFTPAQKPLIVEVLRQLRGALAARITITRMEEAGESDIAGRNSTPNVAIDPRTQVAADLGARPHQLTPIPMSNGQTAWAVTQPPTEPTGRHHKTDDVNDPGRARVVEVFGDACPVCDHSVTTGHSALGRCHTCSTMCPDLPWPARNVQRFQEHHYLNSDDA